MRIESWSTVAAVLLQLIVISPQASGQASTGQIVRIGHVLTTSTSGVDYPGNTFLLYDQVLEDGIIFAFSAFFRAQTPIRFQVWRPRPSDDPIYKIFRLEWELRVIPSVVNAREDIYVISKQLLDSKCFHIRKDDRIGVYNEEAPSSIAYAFNALILSALHSTLDNTSIPNSIGDDVRFDSLHFPYDFSVAAYIDTNGGAYANVTDDWLDCPKSATIDDTLITTTTASTAKPTVSVVVGPPGATGATGPAGPLGPPGPPGNVSVVSSGNATVEASKNGANGSSNNLVNGLLAWLVILTILIILLIILGLLIWYRLRKRQYDLERLVMSLTNNSLNQINNPVVVGASGKLGHAPSTRSERVWMSDMKEEVESQYSVGTYKERTPLSKTGPFVYNNENFDDGDQNDNQLHAVTDDERSVVEARQY